MNGVTLFSNETHFFNVQAYFYKVSIGNTGEIVVVTSATRHRYPVCSSNMLLASGSNNCTKNTIDHVRI